MWDPRRRQLLPLRSDRKNVRGLNLTSLLLLTFPMNSEFPGAATSIERTAAVVVPSLGALGQLQAQIPLVK